ncbi:hypothetical protein BVRB_5g115110 [Beta vulgaris subsp. vulgaris]|nr:hypothetical protein BVRB_5g115110 [Beta vulgaris subsp. vulgaris]
MRECISIHIGQAGIQVGMPAGSYTVLSTVFSLCTSAIVVAGALKSQEKAIYQSNLSN